MMNRFMRILIVINGIIIPLLVGILLYEYISDKTRNRNQFSESIIVGGDLEKAKASNVALQGLFYNEPEKVYHSDNFYLPVSVMTYKEAKDLKAVVDVSDNVSLSHYNIFNVLFLDKDYNVIGKLLDKKASISDIQINSTFYYNESKIDTTVKHIAYLIGFDDSNKDGKLNNLDFQDLFISDLNGKNLTQVTSNKNINEFQFINSNSEILVSYKARDGVNDEHNRIKFGLYRIDSGVFSDLKEIDDALGEIEKALIL